MIIAPIIERRYALTVDRPEAIGLRAREGSGEKIIAGISPPWDSPSVDLGGFREIFKPEAFDKLLDASGVLRKKFDVPFLTDHVSHLNTGRTANGRLVIRKGVKGLEYEHDPLLTTAGRDLLMMIDDGTITGASFAFTTDPKNGDDWKEDERGNVIRTVTRVDGLFDISAVTYPAYPRSEIGLRSLPAWKEARGVVAHRQEPRPLVISLDFDRTYTAAPGLWRSFVADATNRGNRIVCISRREDSEENREAIREAFDGLDISSVVLCGPETQKRDAARVAGLEVDVWVDDYPEGIPAAGELTEPRAVKVSTLAGRRAAAAAAVARMQLVTG